MTKKDFIALANALRVSGASRDVRECIADVCAESSPTFDREKFLAACKAPRTPREK